VAIPGAMYRALMSSDHEAEIRASVAARADLGPGYDDAVAEGLVERIGAEIDKRIDARLAQFGPPGIAGPPGYQGPAAPAGAQSGVPRPAGAVGDAEMTEMTGMTGMTGMAGPPGPAAPAPSAGYQGYQAPIGYQGYPGYQGYLGPVLPPGYQLGPPPGRPSQVAARNVTTTIIALGSMGLGVGATAILSHAGHVAGQGLIIVLVWVAVAIVNVAYARRL
jgi:hypothetical protein